VYSIIRFLAPSQPQAIRGGTLGRLLSMALFKQVSSAVNGLAFVNLCCK